MLGNCFSVFCFSCCLPLLVITRRLRVKYDAPVTERDYRVSCDRPSFVYVFWDAPVWMKQPEADYSTVLLWCHQTHDRSETGSAETGVQAVKNSKNFHLIAAPAASCCSDNVSGLRPRKLGLPGSSLLCV